MDAIDFVKERNRICKFYDGCHNGCPLMKFQCASLTLIELNLEEFISTIEEWSKEHPVKTMLQKFKEDHPNAPVNDFGCPLPCPYDLGYTKTCGCSGNSCTDCWGREYKED